MQDYSYKNSGVEWLGIIPEHWKIDRLRDLCIVNDQAISNSTSPDFKLNYIDIGNVNSSGIVDFNKIEELSFGEAPSRARRKIQVGDTIISSVRTNLQAVAFIDFKREDLIGSTGFFVCRPRFSEILDNKFLYYFVLTDYSKDFFFSHSVGVSYPAIDDYKFSSINIPLPPLPEQKTIADYLDKACTRIDRIIAIKEEQLRKIEGYYNSRIHEVITKGLNENVELIDSSIDWQGLVPQHWKCEKLFRLSDKMGSGGTPKSTNQDYYDGDIPWVQSGDLNDGLVYETKKKINERAIQESSAKMFEKGTVLIAMYGATIGKLGIMGMDAATNQACCAIQVGSKLYSDYVFFLLYDMRQYLISQGYGGGQNNISQEVLKQQYFFFPAKDEQLQIVSFIKKFQKQIDSLWEKVNNQITTLQAYRKSLIHECVTGKKQVADLAPLQIKTAQNA